MMARSSIKEFCDHAETPNADRYDGIKTNPSPSSSAAC